MSLCIPRLAVYGTLGHATGWRGRTVSSSLTPPGEVLDGQGRETPRRRTASRESQTRRPGAPAARIAGVSRPVIMITFVSGETSRSRACTCRPLMSGIHTSTKARDTAWHRACAKKTSAFRSSAPSARRNRAVAQSNSAPRRRHRECRWNQAVLALDSTYSNRSAALSLRYVGAALWYLRHAPQARLLPFARAAPARPRKRLRFSASHGRDGS